MMLPFHSSAHNHYTISPAQYRQPCSLKYAIRR